MYAEVGGGERAMCFSNVVYVVTCELGYGRVNETQPTSHHLASSGCCIVRNSYGHSFLRPEKVGRTPSTFILMSMDF